MRHRTPADEIEDRLINLGVRIIKLSRVVGKDFASRHVSRQIIRCGTSPAPNYAEARGAESKADFIHKLSVVLKELNETRIWLLMIQRADLVSSKRLERLIDEVVQLSRIIQASVQTTRASMRKLNDK